MKNRESIDRIIQVNDSNFPYQKWASTLKIQYFN